MFISILWDGPWLDKLLCKLVVWWFCSSVFMSRYNVVCFCFQNSFLALDFEIVMMVRLIRLHIGFLYGPIFSKSLLFVVIGKMRPVTLKSLLCCIILLISIALSILKYPYTMNSALCQSSCNFIALAYYPRFEGIPIHPGRQNFARCRADDSLHFHLKRSKKYVVDL